MAIKKVDEIPQTPKQKHESYRENIRTDINEALASGITKFEFDGDYNYKYLAQYVREECRKVFRPIVMNRGKEIVETDYPDIENATRNYWGSWDAEKEAKRLYTVTSYKGADRIHVYFETHMELLDDVCREIINFNIERYERIVEMRLKREAAKKNETGNR